jgi:transposase
MVVIKMMKKQDKQNEYIMSTLDELVPEDNELRLIEKHFDFEFIYEATKPLYSEIGRPSVDPVNIFKIELINILNGYNSIRKTIKEINLNVAYRWFLNIPFSEPVPHFSTISQLYRRKFEENEVYEQIFLNIMKQLREKGLINTKQIYIDGTHIKASANKKKFEEIEVEKDSHAFEDIILERLNETRINDGLREVTELKRETITRKISTTDPECGYFVKGEKEKQMAYVAQVVCDENGYALDCEVVPGNVHDSQSCRPVLERVLKEYDVSAVAADSGYKNGAIAQFILSYGALFFTSYTRPKGMKGYFKTNEFIYDEYYNQILCPNDKILRYRRTDTQGYKIFEANKNDCESCPFKSRCTTMEAKQVHLSVFHDILEYIEELRHTDYGKETYKKRKEKIERLFGDGKEKYGMRYTHLRGRNRVRNHILLTLGCMNLKKGARHLERLSNPIFNFAN